MIKALAVLATTIALVPAASFAGPCGDAAERLAVEHDLRADPAAGETPVGEGEAPAGGGATLSDRLAQTGGVLTPPDTGAADDEAVIEPPDPDRFPMPTTPDVQAEPPSPSGGPPAATQAPGTQGPEMQQAADRLRAESLLMAARSADDAGDAETCRERLAEARDVLGDTGVAEQ